MLVYEPDQPTHSILKLDYNWDLCKLLEQVLVPSMEKIKEFNWFLLTSKPRRDWPLQCKSVCASPHTHAASFLPS